jgi:hypothetical protein
MDAFPEIAGGGINMDQQYVNIVFDEGETSLVRDNFVRTEETEAMRKDIERQFNRKEFLDLIQDHKSNWIPGSKGGEPNCRKDDD